MTAEEPAGEGGEKNGKIFLMCRKCRRLMRQAEKCVCRPWLCYKCCECGLDCDLCGCSHKSRHS